MPLFTESNPIAHTHDGGPPPGPAFGPLLVIPDAPGAPAWNMAADEALLHHVRDLARPVLRYYSWTLPAATFGYFQRHAEVAAATLLRPLIRRPTGGGIVPHDRDWTYSLTVPPGHCWYELKATESYRKMHQWVVDAFHRLGVPTELAPCCRRSQPGQCFMGYEQFDVLWGGRKIAGAAQRRNRDGLLIQGSIQPPPGLSRATWQQAMYEATPRDWVGTPPEEGKLATFVMQRAASLESSRYALASYNESR